MQRLVEDWQGPIYNLAYRMLGNEVDAADATQDVFVRLLKTKSSIPVEDERFRVWVLRVAKNAVINYMRDRTTRRRKEGKVVPPLEVHMPQPSLDAQEIQGVVRDIVAELPAEERLLIVLHYGIDVSQSELAAVLEIPRTTLQSRLSGALRSVKRRIGEHGYALAIPCVESILTATPEVPVPAIVTEGLKSIGTSSALGAASSTLVGIGGALTMKVAFTIGVVTIVIGLALGYQFGAASSKESSSASVAVDLPSVAASAQVEELEEEVSRLRQLLSDAEKRYTALELATRVQESTAETAAAPDDQPTPTFDFSILEELLSANRKLFSGTGDIKEQMGAMSPDSV